MDYLKDKQLHELIPTLKQPVLGICLGMQLMCDFSEENATTCMGIFNHTVKKLNPTPTQKVPHMGWNELRVKESWIDPTVNNKHVYFVHSFYVPVNENTSAVTEYTVPFSAAIHRDNFYAVQFHPEKSAQAGELVLKSFLKL
jgi:glutamine amidotransferase